LIDSLIEYTQISWVIDWLSTPK